jgi:2-C-methyl-D-erythritol 4-phosphate cytidylyltransferase
MNTTVIIPAAGLGKRLKSKTDKPFVLINGKPLIAYTLQAVSKCRKVADIILVVDKKNIDKAKKIIKKYDLKKVAKIIQSGLMRTDSVENGMMEVSNKTDLIAVHDGARPFISEKIFHNAIDAAKKYNCSCVCVKVKPTIKKVVNGKIIETIDRSFLWEAQTPQVFKKSIFQKAYNKRKKDKLYTDDMSLVEGLGVSVRVVEGDYNNIKITTSEDLEQAKRMLK